MFRRVDCVSVFLRDDEQLGFISFGQLCLGLVSPVTWQVFPPVPVSSWLSRQEVQRSSFRKQSIMCGWGAQV